jgi:hypothetical protein
VGGLEVVISKDGGFPDFSTKAGNIDVVSSDTDGDSQNEVVITWPSNFTFGETQYVRLKFNNEAAMPITLAGTATDGAGDDLATGNKSATVPAGGVGEVDLTLSCLTTGCTAVDVDAGVDMGIPDAGPDAQLDAQPDVGPDVAPDVMPDVMPDVIPDMQIFPDTTVSQVGETVTAAGHSSGTTDGGVLLEIDHQLGNMGRGVSSADGGLELESVLTITR